MSAAVPTRLETAGAMSSQVSPRTLAVMQLLLVASCIAGLITIRSQPGTTLAEMALFAGAAIHGTCTFVLLRLQKVQPESIARWTLGFTTMILAVRILVLGMGGYFDDPARSFFMPVFAYLPMLFLLAYLLLDMRHAVRFVAAAWLGFSLGATWITYPYWHEVPLRSSLPALLAFSWIGHATFAIVIGAIVRQWRDALSRQGTLLESEQQVRAQVAESELRFRSIFDQAAIGIALLDENGRWLKVNRRLAEITGYTEAELLQIDFQRITHPDDLQKDVEQARKVIAGEIDGYEMEKRYLRKDGSVVWIELHVARIDATPSNPTRFVSVIEDLTRRKALEQRAAALSATLEAKVAARTSQLQESLALWQVRNQELNLVTDLGGFLAAAQTVEEAGRISAAELSALFRKADGALYLHDETSQDFALQSGWGVLAEGMRRFERGQCWALRRGQEYRVEEGRGALLCRHATARGAGHSHTCVPLIAGGEALGVLELSWGSEALDWVPDPVLLSTVARQLGLAVANLRLREELRRQAIRDPLTGLYNRRLFDESLAQRHARSRREGPPYALLMMDLDHFKTVNDRFGHDGGDLVLRELGALLRAQTRIEENVFRLGGEEFALLMEGADAGAAREAGERICNRVRALGLTHRGEPLPPLSISVGIAISTQVHDHADLVAAADRALYAAKSSGRDRVVLDGEVAPMLRLRAARAEST